MAPGAKWGGSKPTVFQRLLAGFERFPLCFFYSPTAIPGIPAETGVKPLPAAKMEVAPRWRSWKRLDGGGFPMGCS